MRSARRATWRTGTPDGVCTESPGDWLHTQRRGEGTKHDGKDLRRFLPDFFPPLPLTRGPRTANPDVVSHLVESVHYTANSLLNMTPFSHANFVADTLDKLAGGAGATAFSVADIGAGAGGNTLAFLALPHMTRVVAFESDPAMREMLCANLAVYGVEGDPRLEIRGEFAGAGDEFPTGLEDIDVLYFDPPWTVPGSSSYIQHGIRMGGRTIEEWLEAAPASVRFCSVRFPPNYELAPVAGWRIWSEKVGAKRRTIHFGVRDRERECKSME